MKSGDKTLTFLGIGAAVVALYLYAKKSDGDIFERIEEYLGTIGSGSGLDLSGIFEGLEFPSVQFPDMTWPEFTMPEMPTIDFDKLTTWFRDNMPKVPDNPVMVPDWDDAFDKAMSVWDSRFNAFFDDMMNRAPVPEGSVPVPDPTVPPAISESDPNWLSKASRFLSQSTLRSWGIGLDPNRPGISFGLFPGTQLIADLALTGFQKRYGYEFFDQGIGEIELPGMTFLGGLASGLLSIFKPSPVMASSAPVREFAGVNARAVIRSEAQTAINRAAAGYASAVAKFPSPAGRVPATPAQTGGKPSGEYKSYWNQVPL